MKILLNCTTLVKGGALQAAVSFISFAAGKAGEIVWHFAISRQVFDELRHQGIYLKVENVTIIAPSPAKSFQARKRLKDLELFFDPDVIFTFFGPAYVRFNAPHLCGIADGWVTHANRLAFRTSGGLKETLKIWFKVFYKVYWYKKADGWVTEILAAKEGLVRRFFFNEQKIEVVPNTCSKYYLTAEDNAKIRCADEKVKILSFSAYYPHKNLEIIPFVAEQILAISQVRADFEFIVTLPNDSHDLQVIMQFATDLGVQKYIRNVGPVRVSDGPALYKRCHILFLPSVLETFSANYPEAMAMGVPIVTTDLRFARDVCKEAAIYFAPKDPKSAAEALFCLFSDNERRQALVHKGKEILNNLPSAEGKYKLYVTCLINLYERTKSQDAHVARPREISRN